jgi:transposase, IS5 family
MEKTELARLINPEHPLVKLAQTIDWQNFDEQFGISYSTETGRPGISTRLMVGLHYLKYTHDLSDEAVLREWVENPYWQYLSGMRFFEHQFPIDPSTMSRWRSRISEAGAEELLKETIQAGLRLRIIKPSQLKRVNVDTTVQEKHIRFPTDARLYDRMRQRLVKAARKEGIALRQSYVRVGKRLLTQHSRYAGARQFRRARHCTRKLHTILGRVSRDIERKCARPSAETEELLALARRLYLQKRHDKGKIYSIHAPEVECISKGKAHKRYEFGSKVSLGVTSKGGWIVAAQAQEGNPYDGRTLQSTMDQLVSMSGKVPEHVYADMNYRGHDYQGESQLHVDRRRRGSVAVSVWRWMKRRAAIEPSIGHLKQDRRMERNRLKGSQGDRLNAVLSAAGMNFAKLLTALEPLWSLLTLRLLASFAPRLPDSDLAATAGSDFFRID